VTGVTSLPGRVGEKELNEHPRPRVAASIGVMRAPRRRYALALALALTLLALCHRPAPAIAAPAIAAPPATVQLRYTRGPGADHCPDEQTIRNAVAVRLGYEPWDPASERVVVVRIAKRGELLEARLRLQGAAGQRTGERVLRTRRLDCAELAASVELAISIAIDPLSVVRPASAPASAPTTRLAATQPAVPRPPSAPTPRSRATPRPAVPLRLSASVGGGLALGAAPAVTGGLGLQVSLRRGWWSLGAAGRFDLPARQEVPGGSVSGSLLAGKLLGCLHFRFGSGCALLAAGALRAAGHDLAEAQRSSLPYVGAGARLAVELPLVSVLSLRLHADLLVALTRITLKETGTDRVLWTLPPASGLFGLAAVVRFL